MVTKRDAPELMDVLTRHQIYLEGLKLHQGGFFDAVLQQLRRDLREIFLDIEKDDLSALTKRELERIIRRIRSAQIRQFNVFREQVLRDLRAFLEVDAEMNVEIMRQTQEPEKEANRALSALLLATGLRKLWKQTLSSPIQANGVEPEKLLDRYAEGSVFALESLLRKAHVNKMTAQATLRAIVGTRRLNYRDGALTKFGYQAQGLVATLIQHAAGIVNVAVASEYFEWYQWVSVLDSRTSDICRSRHGRVYRYGAGPLPPAHINCRSKTVPVDSSHGEAPESYHAWLKEQPDGVLDDIIGESKAEALKDGRLKASDIPKFDDAKPLTLAQFKAKLRFILAT